MRHGQRAAQARSTVPTPPLAAMNGNLVTDGNSLTAAPLGWPNILDGDYPSLTVTNLAVGGSVTSDVLSRGASADAAFNGAATWNVAVLMIGTNDLDFTAATPQDVYDDIVEWCTARRAAGFLVIASHVAPNGDISPQSKRTDLNTLLSNNWQSFADGLMTHPNLGDWNSHPANWQEDHIHWTEAGEEQEAVDYGLLIRQVAA